MKSLVFIPLATVALFAGAGGILIAAGARIHAIDPISAGLISALAGIVGILPIAAGRRKDPVRIFQLALTGTVLHLVAAVALTAAAMLAHIVSPKIDFLGWLLAAYWLSLILLILQLRQRLLSTIDLAKGAAIL